MLTFGYILLRQAQIHNLYYSALLFYACALSFKELNEAYSQAIYTILSYLYIRYYCYYYHITITWNIYE
jgi:hypothetical protein